MPDLDSVRARLEAVGQAHLLAFAGELDDHARKRLLEQIESIDIETLPELVERYVRRSEHAEIPEGLAPAPYYPRDPDSPGRAWNPAPYREAGQQLLAEGAVACFTVAGGQGTRLGYDGPKGCYPTGAVTGKSLFQIFAEGIAATQRRYRSVVPWYIMTSPLNHDATVAYFEERGHFGLERDAVRFFRQGVMPSLDKDTGRVLLAARDEAATNPDGHGGAVKALAVSGAVDDMKRRGVRHVSYFQVDNPNVHVADPVFLGLHSASPDSSAEFSSKMIPKISPEEKVGVFCAVDGRVRVIEYSDLPADLAGARNPDGALRFIAGSIAIHAIGVEFVEKLASDPAFALPYHRAVKKVPHVDPDTGTHVDPDEPNAVKLERFVFDAIPLAERSLVYETDRVEEFAPVKNQTGADSIESSKRLQTERAARWLRAAGVEVPLDKDGNPDCALEISPLTALDPEQLREAKLPARIEPGAALAL